MSNLRARLADALRPNIGIQCVCGRPARECHQRAEHLADALLSLPGIAIVELPEPLNLSRSDSTFPHDIVAYPGGVMDCDCDLSLEDARSIAAALLAAANAAESVAESEST